MNYDRLTLESREYIDRYCRTYRITREQAMQEELVRLVVKEYEGGVNRGK